MAARRWVVIRRTVIEARPSQVGAVRHLAKLRGDANLPCEMRDHPCGNRMLYNLKSRNAPWAPWSMRVAPTMMAARGGLTIEVCINCFPKIQTTELSTPAQHTADRFSIVLNQAENGGVVPMCRTI